MIDDSKIRLEELKREADALGVKYMPNIGLEALFAKVDKAKATTTNTSKAKKEAPKKLSEAEIAKLKASNLRKVRISNLDMNNTGASTVYAAVINSTMELARVVPLNIEVALEEALIEQIKGRRSLSYAPKFDASGRPTGTVTHKQIPTYAIEYLDGK